MLPATALPDPRRERFQDLKTRLHATPGAAGIALENVLPTAVSAIDALLGGGFPLGSLVTLEGPCSSGRWSIAATLLAIATRRGLGAVIDEGELYPPSLEAAGVRLDRLLIVPAKTPVGIARAADLLLRSRAVRVVVMAAPSLRAAVWTRLAKLAQRAGVLLVVVAARAWPELSASASVRLGFRFERAIVNGTRGLWCTFAGFDLRVQAHKHKRAFGGAFVNVRSLLLLTSGV
jgi:hypothetical protein